MGIKKRSRPEKRQNVLGRLALPQGLSKELRKIASAALPASLCNDIQKQPVREEFKRELLKLSGEPLVAIQNAGHVMANLVRKRSSEKVVAHFVNYGPAVESVNVRLNLAGVVQRINPKNMRLLSPDNVAKELKDVSVNGAAVTFTIPKIEVYDVVAIN